MTSKSVAVDRDPAGDAHAESAAAPASPFVTEPISEAEQRQRTVLLVGLSVAMFLVSANGGALAPFLLDLARDLHTDLAAVANLAAIAAVAWGISSLFAGSLSDRLGRKPLLIAGFAIIGAAQLLFAVGQDYATVAASRVLGGIGGGTFMGAVFAAVADRFPAQERGRALGWLTTGQSLALVLGVPLLTLLGGGFGWRGAFLGYGALMMLTVGFVWWLVPGMVPVVATQRISFRQLARLLGPGTFALLCASMIERLCYASMSIFLPTYLVQSYGITAVPLAGGLALIAAGNIFGTLGGGRLADRWPARALLFAIALAFTGAMVLATLLWQPGLLLTIALGFGYTLTNAFGRPALLAALSDVSGPARGAILGLNGSFASVGWLGASACGGYLVVGWGFDALAVLNAALAAFGALLAVGSWFGTRRAV